VRCPGVASPALAPLWNRRLRFSRPGGGATGHSGGGGLPAPRPARLQEDCLLDTPDDSRRNAACFACAWSVATRCSPSRDRGPPDEAREELRERSWVGLLCLRVLRRAHSHGSGNKYMRVLAQDIMAISVSSGQHIRHLEERSGHPGIFSALSTQACRLPARFLGVNQTPERPGFLMTGMLFGGPTAGFRTVRPGPAPGCGSPLPPVAKAPPCRPCGPATAAPLRGPPEPGRPPARAQPAPFVHTPPVGGSSGLGVRVLP
jgi:hypothetical protein